MHGPDAIVDHIVRSVNEFSILRELIEAVILVGMASHRATLTEQVFRALRDDILSGRLEPGSKLPFASLTERYGSSTSAVREGLQRLVEQGLVVSEPQVGFRVADVSLADLDDLTQARCEIEALALRLAVEHGDLTWEASIVATLHTLERTRAFHDDEPDVATVEWSAAHRAFHAALIAGCPNRRIRDMASVLRDSAELYRGWSFRLGSARDVGGEHRAIVDAALARDGELAAALLVDHLEATRRAMAERVPATTHHHDGSSP